jgi:hypothetical protein
MSLNKAIKYGKEKRKPRYKSKTIDTTCCNHNSCRHCESNKRHKYYKAEYSADEQLKEYHNELTEDEKYD